MTRPCSTFAVHDDSVTDAELFLWKSEQLKMCQKAVFGGSHVAKAVNVSCEKTYSQEYNANCLKKNPRVWVS